MKIPLTCECGWQFEAFETEIGTTLSCPSCGLDQLVAGSRSHEEILFIAEPDQSQVTSKMAIASLLFGLLFFFWCVTGVPAILLANRALQDIDRSGGRLKGRGIARAGRTLGIIGCLFTIVVFVIPAYPNARHAARRAQCVNNLKQIGLAFHNYHEVEGMLPPAAITDRNGTPVLSWRVALLPYLEANDLYLQFHRDEPWNSPHNLSLLDKMPSVFACPSDPDHKPGMTNYRVVAGPNTLFTPDSKPFRFEDITDGTSDTILAGETAQTIPWTKPQELSRPGFDSHHSYRENGFNILFVDGSVRFLLSSHNPNILKWLVTPRGGEVIEDHSW